MGRIDKQKVYNYLVKIPCGKVVTYGVIAEHLGNKRVSRAVGNILHENPDGTMYPCYKVVNARGELARSYAFGGAERQKELLLRDGIQVVNGRVDLEKYLWKELSHLTQNNSK